MNKPSIMKRFVVPVVVYIFALVPYSLFAQEQVDSIANSGMPEESVAVPSFLANIQSEEDIAALTDEQRAELQEYLKTLPPLGATVIATTELYDVKVEYQNNHAMDITFTITNGKGVQPGVKYRVDLLKETEDGPIIVATQVYDEEITILENETITKAITYDAPFYLTGDYRLDVTLKNDSGLILSYGTAESAITLEGNGAYVDLPEDACELSLPGDAEDLEAQEASLQPGETIAVTCAVSHTYTEEITVYPVLATYEQNMMGTEVVAPTTLIDQGVTLIPGKKQIITLPLSLVSHPGIYETTLTFVDQAGNSVANTVPVQYPVLGKIGWIQNLLLDRASYQVGDTAEVTLSWQSDLGILGTPEPELRVVLSMTDSDGKICAPEQSHVLVSGTVQQTIPVSILADCTDPAVLVALYAGGTNLDLHVFNVDSPGTEAQDESTTGALSKSLLLLCLVLIVGIIIFFVVRKIRRTDNLVYDAGSDTSGIGTEDATSEDMFTKKDGGRTKTKNKSGTMSVLLLCAVGLSLGGLLMPRADVQAATVNFYGNGGSFTASISGTIFTIKNPNIKNLSYTEEAQTIIHAGTIANPSIQGVYLYGFNLPAGGTNRYGTDYLSMFNKVGGSDHYIGTARAGALTGVVNNRWWWSPFQIPGNYELEFVELLKPSMFAYGSKDPQFIGSARIPYTVVCPADAPWVASLGSCSWPVDGACGSSNGGAYLNPPSSNLCSNGSASGVSTSNGVYSWSCNGSNGGTNASCSATQLVRTNGSCGIADGNTYGDPPPAVDRCAAGSLANFSTNANSYTWDCNGLAGGSNVSCGATRVASVSGECGSANLQRFTSTPSAGLCSAGVSTTVSVLSGAYLWNCIGIGLGGNASCFAWRDIITNGSCGAADGGSYASTPTTDLCSEGSQSSVVINGNRYNWNCLGANGGTSANCSAAVIGNGVCGPAFNGNFDGPPVAGLCSSGGLTGQYTETRNYTCSFSTLFDGPLYDYPCSEQIYLWTCEGEPGGLSQNCSAKSTPFEDGVCGSRHNTTNTTAPQPNSEACASGRPMLLLESGIGWTWTCYHENVGTDARCVQNKPAPSCSTRECTGHAAVPPDPVTWVPNKGGVCPPETIKSSWGWRGETPYLPGSLWSCLVEECTWVDDNGDSCTPTDPTPVVDGECGTRDGTINAVAPDVSGPEGCAVGSAGSSLQLIPGSGWTWDCYGEGGGITGLCTQSMPPVEVPGVCGGATANTYATTPTSDLCSDGSPSSVTVNGARYEWTCAGVNGGSDASCSADHISTAILSVCKGGLLLVSGNGSTDSRTLNNGDSEDLTIHYGPAGSCSDQDVTNLATLTDTDSPDAVDLTPPGTVWTVTGDTTVDGATEQVTVPYNSDELYLDYTVNLPAAPSPSVTLNASGCSVPVGNSQCTGSIYWSFSNVLSPENYSVRNTTANNIIGTSQTNGGTQPLTLSRADGITQNITASANGVGPTTQQVAVQCVGEGISSAWYNNVCSPPPDISIQATPKLIRSGDTTKVIVTVDSINHVNCTVRHAMENPYNFSHDGSINQIKEWPLDTRAITAKQLITVHCTDIDTGLVSDEETTVEVVPTIEET